MNAHDLALALATADLAAAADRAQLIATVRASTYRFDSVFDCGWALRDIMAEFGCSRSEAEAAADAYGDALREVCGV